MRFTKLLVIVLLTTILLVLIGKLREQPATGRIPLPSGLLETCATEIPPQPRNWALTNRLATNLDGTVRVIIMADVCRNFLLGTASTSAFHIVAIPERTASPPDMSPSELQQLIDDNTLLDLHTSSFGEIRPAIVMLPELPKGVVEYDERDEATTRRDLGIELICNRACDPGKVHIRRRSALGANFHYVLFNPNPLEL